MELSWVNNGKPFDLALTTRDLEAFTQDLVAAQNRVKTALVRRALERSLPDQDPIIATLSQAELDAAVDQVLLEAKTQADAGSSGGPG